MKIAAWVPIKMNNERLPGKNTLPLGGKPLCQHVLGELLKLQGVDDVYVFCSEEEIEQYIQKEVIRIPRDTDLNSFSTKINDVIAAFSKAVDADIYVYAQVTSPFLKMETIERGLDAVLSGAYDSALSVKKLQDFLWKDSKPFNYDPADIARTQDLEPLYQETGGFYIYTKELIEKHHRRTGFKPYFAQVSEIEAVDIDYREDYELARAMLGKDNGAVNNMYNIKLLKKWIRLGEDGFNINRFFYAFGYKTCAIYGAGVIGSQLYDSLDKEAVAVKYFIDRNVERYRGLRCVKPEELAGEEEVELIIVTPGYDSEKILPLLQGVHARSIVIDDVIEEARQDWLYYYNVELTNAVKRKYRDKIKAEYNRLYDDYAVNEYTWNCCLDEFLTTSSISQKFMTPLELQKYTIKMLHSILSKDVSLPVLDLVITTKCSLKCKKCFHLIPSYTKDGRAPYDIDVESIKSDMGKLLASVDFIFKVNILGGEPFLHGRLGEILEYLATCENVGYFNIVTNSTIIPDDGICEMLRNKKFHVFINDYGAPSGKPLELAEKCKKFGIVYYLMTEGSWYDFGNLEKLNLTEEELKLHYSTCSYNKCKSLMEGELHTCGFHKHGQKNGLLPDCGDSLRIHQYSDRDLKIKVADFCRTEYFEACDYCNAPSRSNSPAIPAGEQE